jgi:hypothetical protein
MVNTSFIFPLSGKPVSPPLNDRMVDEVLFAAMTYLKKV